MDLDISLVKIVSSPDNSGWGQVHDFLPDVPEKQEKRGRLTAIISTSESIQSDQIPMGREILTRLHEEYFGNMEATAFHALKDSVQKVYDEFKKDFANFELSAVSCVGNALNAASVGGPQVQLLREGMLAQILVSKKDAVVSASGFPKAKDKLIISTSGFSKIFPEGVLKGIIEGKDPEVIKETIAATIHNQDESGNMVFCMLSFNEGEGNNLFVSDDLESKPKKSFSFPVKLGGKVNPLSTIKEKLLGKGLYIRPTFKSLETEQSKKTTLSVGIILFILLLITIVFGIRQKKINEYKDNYMADLESAKSKYEEAITLSGVSGERSRELLYQSKQIIDELEAKEIEDPALTELKKQVVSATEGILKEYKKDSELFINLTLLTSGFDTKEIYSDGERIIALDKSQEKTIGVDIESKKASIVSGPNDLKNIKSIAPYSDFTYALGEDGIYEIEGEPQRVIDKDYSSISIISAFAGNIYLIDRGDSKIYRFSGLEGKFGSKSEWLGEGVDLNLADTRNVVIDGNIWMSFEDGNTIRLLQGVVNTFSKETITPELSFVDYVFTTEESENVYFLDKKEKRIVVFDKEGKFVAQYKNDDFSDTNSFCVSEKERKVIYPKGGELLTFSI